MIAKLTNFDQLDPSFILKKCLEREKEIKRIRSNGMAPLVEHEMLNLYSKIRRDYRILIVDHISFVYHERRDVHGLFWKTCFYKQIEEFRQSIRNHACKLDGLYQLPNNNVTVNRDIEYEQIFITKLTTTFINYLNDSISFYNKILIDLEERITPSIYNAWLDRNNNESSSSHSSSVMMDYIIKSMYRCYLYLGDLSRYQQLYITSEKKNNRNFSDALQHYERAALIMPSSGNTHNQMAVLSTYTDDEFLAVYHYCRSILIQEPFTPGFENLNVLYTKNSNIYENQNHNEYYQRVNYSIMKTTNKSLKLNSFLFHFVYLNGLLFKWTCNMHRDYAQVLTSDTIQEDNNNSIINKSYMKLTALLEPVYSKNLQDTTTSSNKQSNPVVNLELFSELLRELLDEYTQYLNTNTIFAPGNDMIFIRVIVISIFAVHFASGKEANILANNNVTINQQQRQHRHTILESLALQVLYGLVNRTASFLVLNRSQKQSSDALPAYTTLIGCLSIFSEWVVTSNMHYMSNTISTCTTTTIEDHSSHNNNNNYSSNDHAISKHSIERTTASPIEIYEEVEPPSLFSDSDLNGVEYKESCLSNSSSSSSVDWDNKYNANKDILRLEIRARSGMRAALSNMKHIVDRDISIYSNKTNLKSSQTGFISRSEHIHLRGFLPIAEYIEKNSFKDFNPVDKICNSMKQAQERYHRSSSVSKLINMAIISNTTNNSINNTTTSSNSTLRINNNSNTSINGLVEIDIIETNHSSKQLDISSMKKRLIESPTKNIENYDMNLSSTVTASNIIKVVDNKTNIDCDDFDMNEFLDDNVVFKPAFSRSNIHNISGLYGNTSHDNLLLRENSPNNLMNNDLLYVNTNTASNNLLDFSSELTFNDYLISGNNKLSNIPHSNYSNDDLIESFSPSTTTWQPWYDRVIQSSTPETTIKNSNTSTSSFLGLYSSSENNLIDLINHDMNDLQRNKFTSYNSEQNLNHNDCSGEYDLGIANIDNFDSLLSDEISEHSFIHLDHIMSNNNNSSLLKKITRNKTLNNTETYQTSPSLNYSQTAFSDQSSYIKSDSNIDNNFSLSLPSSSLLFNNNNLLSSEKILFENKNDLPLKEKIIPPPPGLAVGNVGSGSIQGIRSTTISKQLEFIPPTTYTSPPPPGLG